MINCSGNYFVSEINLLKHFGYLEIIILFLLGRLNGSCNIFRRCYSENKPCYDLQLSGHNIVGLMFFLNIFRPLYNDY